MTKIVYNLTPEEPIVRRNVKQRPLLKGMLAMLITGGGAFALAATVTLTHFHRGEAFQDNMQLAGILPLIIAVLLSEMALTFGGALVWALFAARYHGSVWHVVAMSFLWAVVLPVLGYIALTITVLVTGSFVLALILTPFELILVVVIVCIVWRRESAGIDANGNVVIWSSP